MDAALEAPSADEIFKSNSGTALKSEGLTWKLLLAGAAYALVLYSVQTILFLFLRPRLRYARIYRPRTYLVPEEQRLPKPPDGVFAWLRPVCSTEDDQIIQKCGLDAFFFLRYVRMMLKVFLPVTLVVLPILAPVNRLSGDAGNTAVLDVFSISNVAPQYTAGRLWVHWILGTLVVVWVCYVIYDETLLYVTTRRQHASSGTHQTQASPDTILVANIPKSLLEYEKLEGIFDIFPGGVRTIHINRDTRDLSAKLSQRDKIVEAIEVAETELMKACASNVARSTRQNDTCSIIWSPREWFRMPIKSNAVVPGVTRSRAGELTVQAKRGATENSSARLKVNIESKGQRKPPFRSKRVSQEQSSCTSGKKQDIDAVWKHYLEAERRKTIRLPLLAKPWFPSLPFLGRKVDRIYHLRRTLNKLNQEITATQDREDTYPMLNNAFVQFNNRISAHLACQSVIHGAPHSMTPRILEIDSLDVIWDNLALGWRQRWIRTCIGLLISAGLIVLYAVPVAFTSFLANLDVLASQVSWLSWLADWPDAVKNVIQGVLPPAMLQLLLVLVPVCYRHVVQFQGVPTGSIRELGVQTWHFLFLFVQVFLVVAVSSSLLGFLSDAAENPKSVPTQLAQTLPRAANYFMSYVLVKALTGSSGALLQPVTLLVQIISHLSDTTPRQKWQRQAKLSNVEWARLFPPLTNIAVIGITFSVIAPLVLVFVSFAFAVHWVVYRYNVLYVYQTNFESGGRFFVAALNQLFTGLYVLELCLVGLFFIATGVDGRLTCIPHSLAMLVVLALTVAYQFFLNRTFGPLMDYLPVFGREQGLSSDQDNYNDQGVPDVGLQGSKAHGATVGRRPNVNYSPHVDRRAFSRMAESRPSIIGSSNQSLESGKSMALSTRAQGSCATQSYSGARVSTVWIPQDPLGISKDEIRSTVGMSEHVNISDEGAYLDEKGRVILESCPPDQYRPTF